jgi:hypothetical protein
MKEKEAMRFLLYSYSIKAFVDYFMTTHLSYLLSIC